MMGDATTTTTTSSSSIHNQDGSTRSDCIPLILTHEGISTTWRQRAARGPASREVEHRNRIAQHIERALGTKIELFISERQPCHGLTVDVLVVPPTEERPFHVLVTRGLSEMHMNVHPLAKRSPSRIELVVCLPKTWEVSLEAFRKSEQHFWPVRQLKRHALFPAIHNTFLSLGHTIANELLNDDIPPSQENPSRPFCCSTAMNSMMLMVPVLLPEEFHVMPANKSNKKKKKKKKRTKKRSTAATVCNGDKQGEAATEKSSESAADEGGEQSSATEARQSAGTQEDPNNTTAPDKAVCSRIDSEHGTQHEVEGQDGQDGQDGQEEGVGEQSHGETEGTAKGTEPDGVRRKGRRKRGHKKKRNGISAGATCDEKAESRCCDEEKQNSGSAPNHSDCIDRQGQSWLNQPLSYGQNKEDVYFYQLLPLYQEEVDFKLRYGLEALLERLEQLPPLDVMTITPTRRNVCQVPLKRKILRAKRRIQQQKTDAREEVVGSAAGGGQLSHQNEQVKEKGEDGHPAEQTSNVALEVGQGENRHSEAEEEEKEKEERQLQQEVQKGRGRPH